ncbi:hypothetical protein GLOIN_2v1544628 [Rhizophagus irregularis DAOM 181602=DAOM 197198]|nr:hypothetical protein GLOIN_2v1544628 [Rhizophagus irregularis DAOM 181602=DAOM 197198]POG77656.1 hypothetical protein GLOIN_2v1544628 [Rhizophagus irregularis DAOM 181602=DAOM 197198]|eukprot:XP_025184522.1 hypothetical protein GLOIN_2v1544628 [Rhizophagus irregularis DAOM 181602=DAOM 197198]
MIIGNPSKLSVFSPKNRRNIIVKYCKRSITLQPKQLNYHVEIPFPLLQDEFIFFNTTSKGFELRSTVKLIRWNHNSIDINFDPQLNNESNSLANTEISNNIDINICIISSYSVNLKIDNRKEEYPLNRIGDVLIAPVVSSFQELHIQNQDETPSGKDKYSNMVTRKRNMRHMRNIQKLYVQDQDEAPLRQSKYSSMVTVRRNKRNLIHAITHPTYPIIGNFVDQLRNGSPFL